MHLLSHQNIVQKPKHQIEGKRRKTKDKGRGKKTNKYEHGNDFKK